MITWSHDDVVREFTPRPPAVPTRVTIADLAKAAGVSKASVSLALAGKGTLGPELRARIVELARELGYRPDPALSRIAAGRWKNHRAPAGTTLAYLDTPHPLASRELPHKTPTILVPTNARLLRNRLDALGYGLEVFNTADYPSARALARVLVNRGIPGLLLGPLYKERFVQEFPWGRFASVSVHDGYVTPPVHHFVPDYVHAIRQCWDQVLACGYRRPGLVLFHEMHEHRINFLVPACHARLQAALPAPDRLPVHYYDLRKPRDLATWFHTHRPDAVIGFNDAHYWALHDLGLVIPRDCAVVSLLRHPDDPANPVAGTNTSTPEMLLHALGQLDTLIRRGEYGPPQTPVIHSFVGSWHDAPSLPRAPARAETQ
jgi:LacI family transcriptional regulator